MAFINTCNIKDVCKCPGLSDPLCTNAVKLNGLAPCLLIKEEHYAFICILQQSRSIGNLKSKMVSDCLVTNDVQSDDWREPIR